MFKKKGNSRGQDILKIESVKIGDLLSNKISGNKKVIKETIAKQSIRSE